MGAKLITMTGNPESTLARIADVHLNVAVAEEACPLNLAPTASTTATLAMGDALAVALLKNRGFTAEDFARSHPSGSLGKRLLLRVGDVMRTGDDIPAVGPEVRLRDGLMEMTQKGLGMTAIVDDGGSILGIFTDGDLRRALLSLGLRLRQPAPTERGPDGRWPYRSLWRRWRRHYRQMQSWWKRQSQPAWTSTARSRLLDPATTIPAVVARLARG